MALLKYILNWYMSSYIMKKIKTSIFILNIYITYLNLYFIKKYIHIFFKSNYAEASLFLKALLNKFFSINHEAENYPFHILNL